VKFHLAQVNIARMRAPLESAEMAEFFRAIAEINRAAEESPGFVWRFQSENGNATEMRAYDDPLILFNLSVWESPESLKNYAYRAGHGRFFARRQTWFARMESPSMALWWIGAGTLPGVTEARERLEHRAKNGDSPRAFSFQKIFPSEPET
jgi:hypothetical protein